MDVVGRVKGIGEAISKELQSRKEKLAADAKDAIRLLAKCVKDLEERAERGSLTKVDPDLDALAAEVTRKMGRIALGAEEAKRAKSLLTGLQEEVLSIRSAKAEGSHARVDPNPELAKENAVLKEENTQLEKDLAFVNEDLTSVHKELSKAQMELGALQKKILEGGKPDAEPPKAPAAKGGKKTEPAKKPTPESGSGGGVTSPAGEGAKTPEQEAEEQAGGKKGDATK